MKRSLPFGGYASKYKKRKIGEEKVYKKKKMSLSKARLLGVEKKFFDTGITATLLTASANCSSGELDISGKGCLNWITQGDGESNRDGRKYRIVSIQVKGTIYYDGVANQTSKVVSPGAFVALVQDTQSNGTQLNSEDVFVNPSGSSYTVSSLMRNIKYASRFKVLRKKTLTFVGQPAFDGTNIEISGNQREFNFWVSGIDIPVECTANGGTIADIMNNSFHVIGFSNGNGNVYIQYNCRVRFVG